MSNIFIVLQEFMGGNQNPKKISVKRLKYLIKVDRLLPQTDTLRWSGIICFISHLFLNAAQRR
jgi:hypothetical protein